MSDPEEDEGTSSMSKTGAGTSSKCSMTQGASSKGSAMHKAASSKGSAMKATSSSNRSAMDDAASSNRSAMQGAASLKGSAMHGNTQQSIGGGRRCTVPLLQCRQLRRKRRRDRAMLEGGRAASTGVAICMPTEAAKYTQQSIGGGSNCVLPLKKRRKLRQKRCRMMRRARAMVGEARAAWRCTEVLRDTGRSSFGGSDGGRGGRA